ncbi:myristylated protein [Hypsugopox virus]|nr:myristylated protein [Hypsugopox virus]
MDIKKYILNVLIDYHGNKVSILQNKHIISFTNLCKHYILSYKKNNKYLIKIRLKLLHLPKYLIHYIWFPISKWCDKETQLNVNNIKWVTKKIKKLYTEVNLNNIIIGNIVYITIHNVNNICISKFCINLLNDKLL